MRRKRFNWIALLLLALLVGGLGWLIYMPVRQERLNHALIAAIKQNNTQKTLALLDEGADPNSRDEPPQQLSLWRLLLNELRGKHPAPSTSPTALLLTVQRPVGKGVSVENILIIKALLDKGADVNLRNELGTTALMSAASYGHLQAVKLLLERGANVNLRDKPTTMDISELGKLWSSVHSGRTALMYAFEFNDDLAVMKLLLDHGANPDARDCLDGTLLMHAAAEGNIQKAQLLLDRGANVNARDEMGTTPLIAANNGYPDNLGIMYLDPNKSLHIMHLLLQRGAQVNARDANGGTALMEAARLKNTKAVRLLLAAEAQVDLHRRDGKTALMLAQGHPEVVSLLQKAGEKE